MQQSPSKRPCRRFTVKGPKDDFSSNLLSPTICIEVSHLERKYIIHKKPLIAKCPYFATLFSSELPCTDVATDVVKFEGQNCTSEAFNSFISFIYNGQYECAWPESTKGERCLVHASTYILAERLRRATTGGIVLDCQWKWSRNLSVLFMKIRKANRPQDRMRSVITMYIAANIGTLRKDPVFISCLRDYSELLEDLLQHVDDTSPQYDKIISSK
ncbi:hypothetical protein GP486_006113 [Trichoglossum hirsutum]|uniref:BTB domain-containing protein n=1 Tax=Trichoglossum hirsutum TaxID=265104 RepID=A0A9P8L7Y7_9PEZI|nr:hypothetical protein GP486_006113 [Trichoglossum hirsutum]